MIYDCFSYWDEDLLLDLRLNILDKYVDFFVIVEGNKTWQNNPKKLNFDINKFNKFKKKINFVFKKTPVNWETSKRLNSIKSIGESFFLLLYSDNLVYFNYSNYLKSINKSKIVNLIVQNKLLAKAYLHFARLAKYNY